MAIVLPTGMNCWNVKMLKLFSDDMQFADLRGTSLFTVRTHRTGSTNRFLDTQVVVGTWKYSVPLMKCNYRAVNELTPPFTVHRDCTDCKDCFDRPYPFCSFRQRNSSNSEGPFSSRKSLTILSTITELKQVLKSYIYMTKWENGIMSRNKKLQLTTTNYKNLHLSLSEWQACKTLSCSSSSCTYLFGWLFSFAMKNSVPSSKRNFWAFIRRFRFWSFVQPSGYWLSRR